MLNLGPVKKARQAPTVPYLHVLTSDVAKQLIGNQDRVSKDPEDHCIIRDKGLLLGDSLDEHQRLLVPSCSYMFLQTARILVRKLA